MSWNDLYSQGWAADLSSQGGVCPPWAASLGWDREGVWVVVDLKELEAAAKPLKVYSATGTKARLLIQKAPDHTHLYPHFFEALENQGVPIIAFQADLTLVCDAGVISRDSFGDTYLVAAMHLESQPPGTQRLLQLSLPRRLLLCRAPGSATMGGGPEMVQQFRVRARITLDSGEVFEVGAPHNIYEEDTPTDPSVFLNDFTSPPSLSTATAPSTLPPRPRRASLGQRVSRYLPQLAFGGAGRGGAPPAG